VVFGSVTDPGRLASLAARAAASKQGEAIVVLDVRDLITITDYFVIVSGTSDRQLKTISDEVVRTLKEQGTRPVRQEGEPGPAGLLPPRQPLGGRAGSRLGRPSRSGV
jgi:ribosome-associated protein